MICPLESQEGSARLLAYTAGKLDGRTRLSLESHLESCAGCREFVRGQNAVWSALDLWEPAPVSPDFDRRLYQRIARQVSWWDMLLAPFRPAFRHALPVAAAGALVFTAVVLMDHPSAPPPRPAPSAQVETLRPDQVEHALAEVEMLDQFNRLMRSDSPETAPKM